MRNIVAWRHWSQTMSAFSLNRWGLLSGRYILTSRREESPNTQVHTSGVAITKQRLTRRSSQDCAVCSDQTDSKSSPQKAQMRASADAHISSRQISGASIHGNVIGLRATR